MIDTREPSHVTIADVAQRAKVSTATVSRVVNKSGLVAPETADRVWSVIRQLNYVPHMGARVLASQKSRTLGLILPGISGYFFSELLRGIENGVAGYDYNLLIYSTHRGVTSEQDFYLPLNEHNTDGLIIFTEGLEKDEIARLTARQLPIVLLHQSSPAGLGIPCVTFENKNGSRAIVEHLIKVHKRRRIAHLAGSERQEDSYWRELGYRQALEQNDIVFDPALVALGDFEAEAAEEAVDKWLAEDVELDAIFAADDESALGAITALRRAGKRIPQDIAVVGFDDAPFSRHLTPALTTVRAPIEGAGKAAAEQLIRLIESSQVDLLTLLPTEPIFRQSCGC
ncbi:MAG: LacI family DNA-binding transcriptional regulator [Anaerolineaceae bacterium]|nr:MAG: LacI family DNA-binding transcriptional regulator [Anaerolineaceae bacterium]